MDMKDYKLIDRLQADFDKISSKDAWTPQEVCLMKDLEKVMYYIEVRDAMKNGGEYDEQRNSYDGRSYRSAGRPMSSRRYYDDEKEHSIRRLRSMMENEENHEIRAALQNALRHLETN